MCGGKKCLQHCWNTRVSMAIATCLSNGRQTKSLRSGWRDRAILSADRIRRLDEAGFSWNRLDEAWERMFTDLAEYRRLHANCDVPNEFPENPRLGKWIERQRMSAKRGKLESSRLQRLGELGFKWDIGSTRWDRMLAELNEYRRLFGDCNVPHLWPHNPQLGRWVFKQRQRKKANKLSADRVCRLEEAGIDWEPLSSRWERMFAALVDYEERNSHCNVPTRWSENPELPDWLREQRQLACRGKLKPEYRRRLEQLGVVWRLREVRWEEMFAALKRFQEKHGHTRVPETWTDDPRLPRWVFKQRSRKGALSAQRIRHLKEIGFE